MAYPAPPRGTPKKVVDTFRWGAKLRLSTKKRRLSRNEGKLDNSGGAVHLNLVYADCAESEIGKSRFRFSSGSGSIRGDKSWLPKISRLSN